MSFARRHVTFLRLLLVAWVACGLLIQPVLAALSELHALEHATALDSDHHHDHVGGDDRAVTLQASPDGETPHDLTGLHGLLHAYAGMSAVAVLDLPTLECACLNGSDPPSATPDRGRFASHPSFPFRPPIA